MYPVLTWDSIPLENEPALAIEFRLDLLAPQAAALRLVGGGAALPPRSPQLAQRTRRRGSSSLLPVYLRLELLDPL